jgi:hypothetical protein
MNPQNQPIQKDSQSGGNTAHSTLTLIAANRCPPSHQTPPAVGNVT